LEAEPEVETVAEFPPVVTEPIEVSVPPIDEPPSVPEPAIRPFAETIDDPFGDDSPFVRETVAQVPEPFVIDEPPLAAAEIEEPDLPPPQPVTVEPKIDLRPPKPTRKPTPVNISASDSPFRVNPPPAGDGARASRPLEDVFALDSELEPPSKPQKPKLRGENPQGELTFDGGPRGKFSSESPNQFGGEEDLDVPAYLRHRNKG
jgi:hypothetical protein